MALAGDAVSTAMLHAGLVGRAVWDAWNLLQWPVLAGVGFLAFLLLYRYAPAAAASWRSLRPGALLALVLWLAFSVGFSVYVNAVPSYNAIYGALAGVVILMLYMYYSALVLLVGPELNRVTARRRAEAAYSACFGAYLDAGIGYGGQVSRFWRHKGDGLHGRGHSI